MVSNRNLAFIYKVGFGKRLLCTSVRLSTVYDPARFTAPIVKIEELNKPLPPDDPRHQMHFTPMKADQTPVFYRHHIVDKMIRMMMIDSNKQLIRTQIYGAFEVIKRIQYGKWFHEKDESKRQQIILDPFVVAERAIMNCRPVMQLKKLNKNGTIYSVPYPVGEEYSTFMAIKMMRDILREKCRHGKHHFRKLLAIELIDAMNNEGFTIQAKQDLHRLCEANRAYSSYRKF